MEVDCAKSKRGSSDAGFPAAPTFSRIGGEKIRNKKMTFDGNILEENRSKNFTFMRLRSFCTVEANNFLHLPTSLSNISLKSSMNIQYFCDWHADLFGIDEDSIPPSENESLLGEDEMEEILERAQALTDSDLALVQEKFIKSMKSQELRQLWIKDHIPRYGRRSRQKQKVELWRNSHEKMECICDVDDNYVRHYVPKFGGGVPIEGQEWKIPHFAAFWEEYWEKEDLKGEETWSTIFEPEPEEEETFEKGLFFRPMPKFLNSVNGDTKQVREQILSSFRPLDCREIRRYRMPYAEALYLELQEDKYFETATYFKYLIVKDYFNAMSPDAIPGRQPLRLNRTLLHKILALLKIAERCSRRKAYGREAVLYLKSAKYFNDHDFSWWWLAEEFYVKAIKVSQKNTVDGGKLEAVCRYIYGTYLLDSVNRVQAAQEQLSKARELSLGKDWNAGRFLNKKQEPVYKECANSLCRALIASSRNLRKNGKPEKALPLIHFSYKLFQDSETSRRDIEMETYFELGMTYLEVGMLFWAKMALRKFLEMAKLENYPRRVCDGYLEMAICYRSENDLYKCHSKLVKYLETATNAHDENLIAFGNRYLGEFHLNKGSAAIASDLFQKAFGSFYKQCKASVHIPFGDWDWEHFTLPHDMELARVLAGLAEGEVLTKTICQMILRARDGRNKRDSLNLLKWKNNGDRSFLNVESDNDDNVELLDSSPSEGEIPVESFSGENVPSEDSSDAQLEEDSDLHLVHFAEAKAHSEVVL